MIKRQIEKKVKSLVGKYPVLSITGPRQSGKTTLVKQLFPDYVYVNFEDIEQRDFAFTDPKSFLDSKGKYLVIDEVQYVPEIFSYIQIYVDNDPDRQYILTGSQNFLLMEKITQSLAGRIAILYLLPFSINELKKTEFEKSSYQEYIFTGGYPRIYDKALNPTEWLMNYITTYVERDARQLLNIGDLNSFQKFIALCAGRIGQLINFTSVSNELSISYHTVQKWLSILETGFITYRLYPHHKNYNKRLVKTPKLYFYDTGLASAILGIRNVEQLQIHFLKGELFENMVITELFKQRFNKGMASDYYFWRNNKGVEIDCLQSDNNNILAIEIKSGTSVHQDFFKNLLYYQKLSGISNKQLILVYGGTESHQRSIAKVLSWKDIDQI
jgi:predicted AAA+ superfamily ATPase